MSNCFVSLSLHLISRPDLKVCFSYRTLSLDITSDLYFTREILVTESHIQSWRQHCNWLAEQHEQ